MSLYMLGFSTLPGIRTHKGWQLGGETIGRSAHETDGSTSFHALGILAASENEIFVYLLFRASDPRSIQISYTFERSIQLHQVKN